MPYTPQTWTNNDPTTPVNGARLTYIENGIVQAVASAPTNAAPNTITVAISNNTPGLTVNQNDTTNNPSGVAIVNTGTGTTLQVTPSDSATGAQGIAITSNSGSGSAGVHGLSSVINGSGNTLSSAANFVSNNSAASTLQVSGHETGRGSIKVTHVNPGSGATADANAAALSVDLQKGAQTGTAAQGLFIDSTTGGTTGALLNVRNNGNQLLKVISDGTFAIPSIVLGNGGPQITMGTGSPAVAAPVGSLFLRTDGGAGSTLYVKESGTGTSGWVAK